MELTLKIDGFRIIEHMGTRLEISFNKYWLNVMKYWIKKMYGTPILQYDKKYFVLVNVKDYGSTGGYLYFYPLAENKFIYSQLWIRNGKLYFEPSGPPPEQLIHSDLHESLHGIYCDICGICLECNEDDISYYDSDGVRQYNEKYDTDAQYICEYCMDEKCLEQ